LKKTSNNKRIYPKGKLPIKTRKERTVVFRERKTAGVSQLFTCNWSLVLRHLSFVFKSELQRTNDKEQRTKTL